MCPTKTLGLALGGGGSRALCHLGVLSVLAEESIPVGMVSGSSFGGLVGAMLAFESNPDEIQRRAVDYFAGSDLFGGAAFQPQDGSVSRGASLMHKLKTGSFFLRFFASLLFRSSFWTRNPMVDAVDHLLPDEDIHNARIPFACNAIDLAAGTVEVFHEGSIRKAVLAGTCIATILPPYAWDGRLFVDAAPVASVPVTAVKALGAEVVLAVDLRAQLEPVAHLRNGFDTFRRLEATSSRLLNEAEVNAADVVLRPEVQDIFWGDFARENIELAISRGAEAARAALPQIRIAVGA